MTRKGEGARREKRRRRERGERRRTVECPKGPLERKRREEEE
jgi:DNA helicase TIP49 (TBP-interacting protein)